MQDEAAKQRLKIEWYWVTNVDGNAIFVMSYNYSFNVSLFSFSVYPSRFGDEKYFSH